MAKYMKVPEDPEVLDQAGRGDGDLDQCAAGQAGRLAGPADWQANLTLLKETGGIAEVKPLPAYFTNDYLQIAWSP